MLPKEVLVPYAIWFVIIGYILVGVLFILHFKRAVHLLFLMLLFTFTAPLLVELLPSWVILIVMGVVALVFLQIIAGFIFGQRAADSMIGSLTAGMVRALVRILILPLGIIRRILRNFRNG